LHHDNAPSHISFFNREFLTKKQYDSRHPTNLLFSVSRLKIKLKGCHFDTIQEIEAESQAALNVLTEHDFQNVFKKWQRHWERCTRAEGDYIKGDGGQ
jgi:hypothetical protein